MSGSIEIRVRYAETDQMGRAHHSNHLIWCELGRTALMRERGVSYADMERDGVLLPVARADVVYRGAVEYDDLIRIETVVERVRSRDILFSYTVTRAADGAAVATATTLLVSTGRDGRPMRLPPETRSALEGLVSVVPEDSA